MKHVIKTVPFTVTVLLALAVGAASASAALPEWVAAKSEVAFKTETGKVTLTATKGSNVLSCEKGSLNGEIVSKSPSVKDVTMELAGKCSIDVEGTEIVCTEPYAFKQLSGTLGYIEDREGGPVGLELKPEHGTELLGFDCASAKGMLTGAFVGEILPELKGKSQYNSPQRSFEGVYAASGSQQDVQTLLTAGGFETKIHTEASGWLGTGEAALKAEYELTSAEAVEIKT